MDNRIIFVLAIVVFTAGCVEGIDMGGSAGQGNVEVVDFSSTDTQLYPGQQAGISLVIENHNPSAVEFEEISLYGMSFLEVDEESSVGCDSKSLEGADPEFVPALECSWIVEAPESEGGIQYRPDTIQLNLQYETEMASLEPIQLEFKDVEDIEFTERDVRTFSNGEVSATVEYSNPVSVDGDLITFELDSEGVGSLRSDYEIEYRSEELWGQGIEDGCAEEYTEVERIVNDEASFSCRLNPEEATTENMFFSVSYKYGQTPNLDIEVIEP